MSFAERISQMGVRLGTPVLAAAIIAVSMGVAPVAAQPAEGEIVIVQSSEPPNIDPGNFDYSQTGPILRQNVIETLTLLDLSANHFAQDHAASALVRGNGPRPTPQF